MVRMDLMVETLLDRVVVVQNDSGGNEGSSDQTSKSVDIKKEKDSEELSEEVPVISAASVLDSETERVPQLSAVSSNSADAPQVLPSRAVVSAQDSAWSVDTKQNEKASKSDGGGATTISNSGCACIKDLIHMAIEKNLFLETSSGSSSASSAATAKFTARSSSAEQRQSARQATVASSTYVQSLKGQQVSAARSSTHLSNASRLPHGNLTSAAPAVSHGVMRPWMDTAQVASASQAPQPNVLAAHPMSLLKDSQAVSQTSISTDVASSGNYTRAILKENYYTAQQMAAASPSAAQLHHHQQQHHHHHQGSIDPAALPRPSDASCSSIPIGTKSAANPLLFMPLSSVRPYEQQMSSLMSRQLSPRPPLGSGATMQQQSASTTDACSGALANSATGDTSHLKRPAAAATSALYEQTQAYYVAKAEQRYRDEVET